MTHKRISFLGTGGKFHDKFVSKEVQSCGKKCDQEIDRHIDQSIWRRNYKLSRKIPSLGLSVLMCSKFYGIPTETIHVPAHARKPSHQHGEIMDL